MISGLVKNIQKKDYLFWLKIAVLSVLLGRAYQHFFWRLPYSSIFWDEKLMHPFLGLLGFDSWDAYLQNNWIDAFQTGVGLVFLLTCILVFFPESLQRRLKYLFLTSGIALTLVALALFKEQFYRFGQFFEYSAQVGVVYLYFWYLSRSEWPGKWFDRICRVLLGLTFLCHGLYALGYYPIPYSFQNMIIGTLPFFDELMAKNFLLFFGVMDMIAVAGLFFPNRKRLFSAALWYCIIWGGLTAFARISGNFYASMPWDSLHMSAYETLYRFPHFLLPLILLIRMKQRKPS